MSISACPHYAHDVVYDRAEGFFICANCALVLGDQFQDFRNVSNFTRASIKNTESAPSSNEQAENENNHEAFVFLRDICENHHFPPKFARTAFKKYQEKFPRLRKKGQKLWTRDEKLAFSLYLACLVEEAPRTIKEIASVCHVKEKTLWDMESFVGAVTVLAPSSLLARVPISLPYKTREAIGKLADKYAKMSTSSPMNILGACAYLVLKKESRELSIGRISQIFRVSCTALNRILKGKLPALLERSEYL